MERQVSGTYRPNREPGEAMGKLIITTVGTAMAFGVSAYRGRQKARIVPMEDNGHR
jgi:hypothetical protein